jgi:hypothetical protein
VKRQEARERLKVGEKEEEEDQELVRLSLWTESAPAQIVSVSLPP